MLKYSFLNYGYFIVFPYFIRKTSQKTYLHNFDPLKPHFYIVQLEFTGVYIIFLSSAQKHRLWVLVRTASSALLYVKRLKKAISKTRIYNFDPLKPHFYVVKLGFSGVYFIFLCSAQNIDCGYSLEPSRRGGSNEYPQSMFWAEILKI